MLKLDFNCYSAAVSFSPKCSMGLDGSGFWSASVRSAAACFTSSSGNNIGYLFCTGNSHVVSEMCSVAILDITKEKLPIFPSS